MAKKKKHNQNNNNQSPSGEIFVYAETIKKEDKTAFHPVAAELLAAARKLSDDLCGKLKVSALFFSNENIDDIKDELFKELYQNGADKIYHIKNENIKSHIGIARAFTELCKLKNPEIFLIGATIEGRSIAPLISSSLDTGLTADCTKLEITNYKNEKKLAATRPTFGGQLMATIL